jgi:hypothetical protein
MRDYRSATRRVLNLLTALSLLLCVAACVLWARSYWREDTLTWTGTRGPRIVGDGERWIEVAWGEGVICLSVRRPEAGQPASGMWRAYSFDATRRDFFYNRRILRRHFGSELLWRMGFGTWGTDAYSRDGRFLFGSRYYGVPFWSVCVLTAVAPAVWLGRYAKWRSRRVTGLCPRCGYDLRATPGRCPECGTPASVSTTV